MGATPLSREIAEKRRLLYQRHGGIMSPTDLAREVGYCARPVMGGQVGGGARHPRRAHGPPQAWL